MRIFAFIIFGLVFFSCVSKKVASFPTADERQKRFPPQSCSQQEKCIANIVLNKVHSDTIFNNDGLTQTFRTEYLVSERYKSTVCTNYLLIDSCLIGKHISELNKIFPSEQCSGESPFDRTQRNAKIIFGGIVDRCYFQIADNILVKISSLGVSSH